VPRLQHQPALEGLRAIAVAVVMARHVELAVLPDSGQVNGGGTVGVAVFFALSGFLITALLVREIDSTGRLHLGRFHVRRALRLMPGFVATIGATMVAGWYFEREWYRQEAIWSATYLNNYAQIYWGPLKPLNHLWTIAFEQHFYLAWPIVVGFLVRRVGLVRAAWVTVGLTAAVAGWRLVLWSDDVPLDRIRLATDTRLDGVLIGCFAGLLWARFQPRVRGVLALAATGYLGFALLQSPRDPQVVPWGYTWLAIASSVLVLYLVDNTGPVARLLGWKPFVAVGSISYGLYLWHFPTYYFLAREIDGLSSLSEALVLTAVSVVLAVVSYFAIERPFLNRKKRVTPSTATGEPAVPTGSVG
jgi:peptidoglycan/LPS O-acetylase OafA/YrhL